MEKDKQKESSRGRKPRSSGSKLYLFPGAKSERKVSLSCFRAIKSDLTLKFHKKTDDVSAAIEVLQRGKEDPELVRHFLWDPRGDGRFAFSI